MSVDGVELPDPCTRWQPDGLRGRSRVLDPAGFDWSDHGFRPVPLAEQVLYELHVGAFSEEGTFDGAIPHLRGLAELGVTAIELMPVAEFPGARGWGYDGVYLSAAHSAYGGPEGLARLVDAAHAEGLAVRARRRLQPPRRVRGEGHGGVRPLLHRPLRDALGACAQLRR